MGRAYQCDRCGSLHPGTPSHGVTAMKDETPTDAALCEDCWREFRAYWNTGSNSTDDTDGEFVVKNSETGEEFDAFEIREHAEAVAEDLGGYHVSTRAVSEADDAE